MNFIKKQILLLSALLSGSGVRGANFSKRKNLKSVLLLGALPPGPLTGALPLYPAGDLGGPHTPHLVGGLWPSVPATSSYSPATWNLFNNPLLLNFGPFSKSFCFEKFLGSVVFSMYEEDRNAQFTCLVCLNNWWGMVSMHLQALYMTRTMARLCSKHL